MARYLAAALFALLAALAVVRFAPVTMVAERVAERNDKRPERSILFIGNSRTFYHYMPDMVREIADSAGAKEKYRIVMHAVGGARFEDHWNNAEVQALLDREWRDVVLQAQSSEHLNSDTEASFQTYGGKLVFKTQVKGATPVLYVTWRYGDNSPYYREIPGFETVMYDRIQRAHLRLAKTYGVGMVNVGKGWERLLSYRPPFSLYEPDGNHPSVHGSYLAALMLYRHFSGGDVTHVTYRPRGISESDAQLIRKVAQETE